MTIATVEDIAAALPTGQVMPIDKASISTQGAGGWSSLWRATGVPAQGSIPGAAAIPTKATTGALFNFVNATGSDECYLALASLACGNAATQLQFVDRLSHMGGLSGTVTTAQTVSCDVNSLKGTRAANDLSDVRWWIEIYTDIGTTAVTCTVTYTRDSDGTTGRTTTLSVGGASPLNQDSRIFEIIPQVGEIIRSIQSVTLSVTTGTAGSFGVTATRCLFEAHLEAANTGRLFDWAQTGCPLVPDDACIAMLMVCGTTSTGTVRGLAKLITT